MATFEVPICKVEIEDHPNADRLEIANIVGTKFQSLVPIDKYTSGDLVAYIPEDAIVPEWIQEKLGVKGKLAGSNKDRVKAVRLRGVYSQGLCFPVHTFDDTTSAPTDYYVERPVENAPESYQSSYYGKQGRPQFKCVGVGDDVSDFLGIEKYEPPIPVQMSGEVFNARGNTLRYDIENYQKYPDVLNDGEEVSINEKIHGTWCCIGVVPEEKASEDAGRFIITSKGLSGKGLAFKLNETNETNLYIRAAKKYGLMDKLSQKQGYFYVLGEVFGHKVQDLKYGSDQDEIHFRAFDIYTGSPSRASGGGRFLNDDELENELDSLGIERTPVLYKGPFSEEVLLNYTDGEETVSGDGSHIREGVVVRPLVERTDPELPIGGRVQLKSVSKDYLTRKDGTEYN